MATTSRKNMKGFYRQKKKNTTGGITKSKSSKSTKNAATPALVSHGGSLDHKETDDFNEQERVLRQFDMNMAYGPCLGMTRLARLERAQRLGLNPPKEIENLLNGGKVSLECLLDGRV